MPQSIQHSNKMGLAEIAFKFLGEFIFGILIELPAVIICGDDNDFCEFGLSILITFFWIGVILICCWLISKCGYCNDDDDYGDHIKQLSYEEYHDKIKQLSNENKGNNLSAGRFI